jgi:coenzyme PQQ precursor peptide PqqA
MTLTYYRRHGYGGHHYKDVMAPMNREPLAAGRGCGNLPKEPPVGMRSKGNAMAWTTPVLVEICIGLEINGYLPAEF